MKSILCLFLALAAMPVVCAAPPPWELYTLPALTSERSPLHGIPANGTKDGEIRLVAARGEFEPGSFLLVPSADAARVEVKAGALIGPGGEIPAANVDVKVVKQWYQAGTAWYSYFADPARRELVPELLLNDETLVRVNFAKQENYLRVGGQYEWISYPKEKAEKAFNYLKEPVADAETLQPVALAKGENKQFWVTVKAPKDAKEGIYRGTLDLLVDGKKAGAVSLSVRVLPFELPAPKTYYDLNNDYLVTLYRTDVLELGDVLKMDREAMERQQRAIYKNLLEHNVFNPLAERRLAYKPDRAKAIADIKREIELMKEAGFPLKPLLSSGWMWLSEAESKNPELFSQRMRDLADTLKAALGHDDIYITSWDEAPEKEIRIMRELIDEANRNGLKLWVTTAEGKHFDMAGYMIDYANQAGRPEREQAEPWHAVGAKIASYAMPHTGPENPDAFRRWEGLARYKANYDGSFNYKYYNALHPLLHEQWKEHVWNDFSSDVFRKFNLVYPTLNGVIDTIAWEGFREGIDDVRYATLLKQEAARAIQSGDVEAVHIAKKALMWLELMNAEKADLNTVRQEMISYILKLDALLK